VADCGLFSGGATEGVVVCTLEGGAILWLAKGSGRRELQMADDPQV
jgi:hypothetical protein